MGWMRFLLAALVVAHHCEIFRVKNTIGGLAAVEAFFFISGFYMAAAYPKYRGRFPAWSFWVSRYLRLYPLYLFVLVFTWMFWLTGASTNITELMNAFQANEAPWLANISLLGQDIISISETSHLMLPVRQSWSISAELVFYACVPFLLKLRIRTLLLICLISLALKVLFISTGQWRSAYFPFYSQLGYFVGGIILFRCREPLSWPQQFAFPLVLLASIYLCISDLSSLERDGFLRNAGMILAIAIAMPTAFEHSNGPISNFLGDLSYGVYLAHFLMIEVLVSAGLVQLGGSQWAILRTFAMVLLSSLIFSAVFELMIQNRIDRWRRSRLYVT